MFNKMVVMSSTFSVFLVVTLLVSNSPMQYHYSLYLKFYITKNYKKDDVNNIFLKTN